jgi:hypothetical protein
MVNGFRVCAERCDQCLFSENKIVDADRRAQILAECARDDTHFNCHKWTLAAQGQGGEGSSSRIGSTCCRGFYDADPGASNLMRIAARLGAVEFVEGP